jgi:ELWxxDGT repeat protein
LLRDVNFNTLTPYSLTSVGSILFFTNDVGLWRTDGNARGATLVTRAVSGPGPLTNVSGTIFFVNSDAAHGPELWKSNGTADGTRLVLDIYPGLTGSYPSQLTNINGTLFFSARDLYHGVEPWILGPLPPAPPTTSSARVSNLAAIPSVAGRSLDPAAFSTATAIGRGSPGPDPALPNAPPASGASKTSAGQRAYVIELRIADGPKPKTPANSMKTRRVSTSPPSEFTNLLDWDKL